jgi:hypothetical protein
MTPVSLASLPGRRLVAQFTRCDMAGSAAVGMHLAVLAVLVEFAGTRGKEFRSPRSPRVPSAQQAERLGARSWSAVGHHGP